MIADFVCNSYKLYRKNIRKNANKQVANAGFDIDYTASELSKKYQFLIFAACNKRWIKALSLLVWYVEFDKATMIRWGDRFEKIICLLFLCKCINVALYE